MLARSVGRGRGENRTYTRTYPLGGTFGRPVGYLYITNGRRGIEQYRNDELTRKETSSPRSWRAREQRPRGQRRGHEPRHGGHTASRRRTRRAQGRVVTIEPQTGKVRVMVSIPEYDPNLIPTQFGRINTDPNKSLLNRTTQELYQPGSTFKVVTATAALDTGKVTPDTVIDGSSPRTISGAPLENSGGEDFGPISFTDALTNSVNTVFAQVGERVGAGTLVEYMKRFGFFEDPSSTIRLSDGPQWDPAERRRHTWRTASTWAAWRSGRAGKGRPRHDSDPDGAGGFGGGQQGPPDGAAPHGPDRAEGRPREGEDRADLQSVVMKPETAEQLTQMMARVVEEARAPPRRSRGPCGGQDGNRRGRGKP